MLEDTITHQEACFLDPATMRNSSMPVETETCKYRKEVAPAPEHSLMPSFALNLLLPFTITGPVVYSEL